MKIKERLAIEIEIAKKRSFTDQLREMELSKSYSKGELAYYERRIDDLKFDMTKEKDISDNWVLNGGFDILYKDWLEQVVEMHLKKRPENDVWNEVQNFLKQYFRLLEYREILKELQGNSFKTSLSAWYYITLHEAHRNLKFDRGKDKITDAIKDAANNMKVQAGKFKQTYYAISRVIRNTKPPNCKPIPSMRIILKLKELFREDPDGLRLVEGYLNKAI